MVLRRSALRSKLKPELSRINNMRMIRKYSYSLRHQKGLADASIAHHLAAINRFTRLTKDLCFKSFNADVAMMFKAALAKETNPLTGNLLSQATIDPIIRKVRGFMEWLAREPGYRSRLNANDIGYLTPRMCDVRRARQPLRKFTSLSKAIEAFDRMPEETIVDQRNKAYVGMHLLTSGRTKAIITLPILSFDYKGRKVDFDARFCETKRQTSFRAYFNPVPKRVSKCVRRWIRRLENEHDFSPLDPIFPKLSHPWQNGGDEGVLPKKEYYQTREVFVRSFKAAFDAVGVEGITPHSLRTTIYREIEKLAKSPLESKVYSMNLGQKDELTLVNSYSNISEHEREKTMQRLRRKARKKK